MAIEQAEGLILMLTDGKKPQELAKTILRKIGWL